MATLQGSYTLTQLLNTEVKGNDPIIDGLLWERDTTILLAKEKVGKSIFGQFLALHLIAGEDFLGELKIPNKSNVIYCQAEGKLAQTKQNFERMLKIIPNADTDRLLLLYYPSIAMNIEQEFQQVKQQIKEWNPPEAKNTIFIGDSLYMMMRGDMKDDESSKGFIENMRKLGEEFQLTYLIMHHAHRDIRNKETGDLINEGDNALFGSFVWKAFPDHILLLKRMRDKHLKMTCDTQRTGGVVSELDIVLLEPDPLYFALKETSKPNDDICMNVLKVKGEWMTADEVMMEARLGKTTVYNSLNRLVATKRAVKRKVKDINLNEYKTI